MRVSITSVQASSVENTSGITHSSLHSCVMSPSEWHLPWSQGAPVEAGDHSTSPALAPSCRCCSVPVYPWQFKHLPPRQVSTWLCSRGERKHRWLQTQRGTLTGAVEIGMERHLRTWSHRSNPHLVPAPRTSSRRLRTSGAFGAWEEHRHSQSLPLPEPAPGSVPGLPPVFRLLSADQPQQRPSQSGTKAPGAGQGQLHRGRCLERAARKPAPCQGRAIMHEGGETPPCTTHLLLLPERARSSIKAGEGPMASLLHLQSLKQP